MRDTHYGIMREFKFFQKDEERIDDFYVGYPASFFRRYYLGLDELYCRRYNFSVYTEEYGRTVLSLSRGLELVNDGQLNTVDLIRSHLRFIYRNITGEIYDVSEEEHLEVVRDSYFGHLEEQRQNNQGINT